MRTQIILWVMGAFLASAATAQQPSAVVERELSRRLAVPSEQLQNSRLHVLETNRAVSVTSLTVNESRTSQVVAARVGQAVKPADVSALPVSSATQNMKAFALPIKFRGLAVAPGQQIATPVDFEAVIMIVRGLRFQQTQQRFDGELAVALTNKAKPADRSVLSEPVKLFVNADADEVSPSELIVSRLADPIRVRIGVRNPAAPFKIVARTLLDEGDAIEMPISKPTITLEPVRSTIEGWGLGRTLVQVQASGLDNPEKFTVTLNTTQGDLSPTPVTLQNDGRGAAELRSEGMGAAVIRASGAPFQDATVTVNFKAPWIFILAALVGALLGWYVRTRGRSKSVRSALTALASALILLAAYMIGIRWLEVVPQAQVGEALAFVVGAIGAYVGLKVLMPKGAG